MIAYPDSIFAKNIKGRQNKAGSCSIINVPGNFDFHSKYTSSGLNICERPINFTVAGR